MLLKLGMLIHTQDVHEKRCHGVVENFGDHTVIIACGSERYVIRKSRLEEQHFQFPNA